MTLYPFDEINALKEDLQAAKSADTEAKRRRMGDYIDEVTDLFVMTYFLGYSEIAEQFGLDNPPDIEKAREVIEERFDGKDYKDRLTEYIYSGTAYDIDRVIDTDTGRIYEAAKYAAAKDAGATEKTWQTMLDDRVRDTHYYLEGVTVPIDASFYSFRGGSTLYPRQWGIPEEDCGCRCYLTYSKA